MNNFINITLQLKDENIIFDTENMIEEKKFKNTWFLSVLLFFLVFYHTKNRRINKRNEYSRLILPES